MPQATDHASSSPPSCCGGIRCSLPLWSEASSALRLPGQRHPLLSASLVRGIHCSSPSWSEASNALRLSGQRHPLLSASLVRGTHCSPPPCGWRHPLLSASLVRKNLTPSSPSSRCGSISPAALRLPVAEASHRQLSVSL